MDYEIRSTATPPEARTEGDRVIVTGVAIPYDTRSAVLNERRKVFRERIMPGAATKTISERDIRACHEHDEVGKLLGRTGSGTLRIADDQRACTYEIDMPNTTLGRDVAEMISRRDVGGSSIKFYAPEARTDWSVENGMALRTVRELALGHISTTASPAYGDTSATLAFRSLGLDEQAAAELAGAEDLPALLELRGVDLAGLVAGTTRPHLAHLYL
jgi:HK97 family phage prohead protease